MLIHLESLRLRGVDGWLLVNLDLQRIEQDVSASSSCTLPAGQARVMDSRPPVRSAQVRWAPRFFRRWRTRCAAPSLGRCDRRVEAALAHVRAQRPTDRLTLDGFTCMKTRFTYKFWRVMSDGGHRAGPHLLRQADSPSRLERRRPMGLVRRSQDEVSRRDARKPRALGQPHASADQPGGLGTPFPIQGMQWEPLNLGENVGVGFAWNKTGESLELSLAAAADFDWLGKPIDLHGVGEVDPRERRAARWGLWNGRLRRSTSRCPTFSCLARLQEASPRHRSL